VAFGAAVVPLPSALAALGIIVNKTHVDNEPKRAFPNIRNSPLSGEELREGELHLDGIATQVPG
jgi:hypothetical protein